MAKVKITAETVKYPGGVAVRGDVIEVSERVAGYLKSNGYAVDPDKSVSAEVADPNQPVKRVFKRGRPKKKAD